ncbi:TetR/AcrR family transcriptional regulator [Perlucidibaca aquatica]|uniref:TetR/AcrR family transcriptional regulator n=1 Tax=Perlucidibaca aquatica TaxID=1852776 RepID=UPI00083B0035|nr:TetR/AcrR family transcriptional regulator [Perlucidibaca aquatica]
MPRKPQQSRAKATVDAILEAGFQAVASHGTQATTRQIAETAGISIGSLYEYFSNKEAIFAAMHERFIQDVVLLIQDTTPTIMHLPPDQGTRTLLTHFGALLQRDDGRYLKVARKLVDSDSLLYLDPIRQMLMQLVTAFIMNKPEYGAIKDLPTMAYIMVNTGIYMMLHHLSDPKPPISFEQLCDGLAGIVRRYITSAAQPS